MMSFCWYSAAFLLLLLTPDLLSTRLLLIRAVPTSSPVTHHKIQYNTEVGFDYDYEDNRDSSHSPPNYNRAASASPPLVQPKPCDYQPCQENQVPCSQLSSQTGCLCPGRSGDDMPPHSPHLQKLVPAADGRAEIRWCAPSSVVSGYRVLIEHRKEPLHFGADSRRGFLVELEAGVKVCVEAINMAGISAHSELSCLRYEPEDTTNLALKAGVIGGGLGLLLLLSLIGLLFWRRKTCGRAGGDSAEGLGNPSYNREGTL
ncbi:hypothetical protein DPEC_G00020590 [Dallia pectoralis]|uniref:Uncharacterized protein n=1 Tax=Dallia pectoralis TaxID=75939 RepID=A0ACC2HGM3_DALPE|nr:hypothetical protein DPEC_G00020590 [Dallia pectoralis]